MRIVHEIETRATVGGGSHLYTKAKGEELASGFRADLLILVEGDHLAPEEEIHIEGDGAYLLRALRDAARTLEICAEVAIERGQLSPDWYKKAEDEPIEGGA